MKQFLLFLLLLNVTTARSQNQWVLHNDVTITLDFPRPFDNNRQSVIVLYALPNGNSTEQTMGKKMQPGDDWHFDIQHIRAQSRFVAAQDNKRNYILVYLENSYKSWPAWKAKHTDYKEKIRTILDTVFQKLQLTDYVVYLNGHSGGGRFIFSVMDAFDAIPDYITRISFLDSDYGYDSVYEPKILRWLQSSRSHYLNVFAYNDSVALYDGKPVVSATGGTWYRSHWMMRDLSAHYTFRTSRNDSIVSYTADKGRIQFFFKNNPDRKIYHTQQVELNGFIHSVFCGTRYDSRRYRYYAPRAYTSYIE